MKRISTLLTIVVLMASCAPALSAAAATASHTPVKPRSAHGHKAPMRHDQLTLYPHGKPARRQKEYSAFRHRFDQPTPIHNTFMGVQRW
jgi:Spy/CpxP family protein refolding chaperone